MTQPSCIGHLRAERDTDALDRRYTLAKSQVDGWPTDRLVYFVSRDFSAWLSDRTDDNLAGHAGGILARMDTGRPERKRLSRSSLDALVDRCG